MKCGKRHLITKLGKASMIKEMWQATKTNGSFSEEFATTINISVNKSLSSFLQPFN